MILCSLILQLEDGAVDLFLKTIKEDCLEISTKGIQKHRTVDEYVQTWHNEIWEYAYTGWFKGKDVYTKTKAFKDHRNTDLVVKRVIYKFGCNFQAGCNLFLV
jgi:hypothetical protein